MLEEIIIQKIRKEGKVSFRDFMEMCLYYPGLGYYTSPGNKTGRNGDFFTSPEFTFLFGELIAKQIEEMWYVMGKPEFTIVEYGAGNALLACDVLSCLSKNELMYEHLKYCIIEKNTFRQARLPDGQAQGDREEKINDKISFYESISELKGFKGCVLTNEVIDNFPVHLVEMHDDLMEVVLNYKNEFIEELQPAGEELKAHLAETGISLPKNYRTEINLEIKKWLTEIAGSMESGHVLTIDYGYASQEYYQPARNKGTLLCFHQHSINQSPYTNIGRQDITSHVDFSGMLHYGEKNGFQFGGFTDQVSFLRSLGLNNKIREIESKDGDAGKSEKMRMLHTFLFDMGKKFKVLLLQKNVPQRVLTGFLFNNHHLKDRRSRMETFITPGI